MSERIPLNIACLSAHHDADGIYSAALIGIMSKVEKITFPDKFGNYDRRIDVMVDQRPIDAEYTGLCIDHHPDHPDDRKYELIHDTIPTTGIVYRELEERIKENKETYRQHAWKVVGGLVGDGSPEFAPSYIWKDFPLLQAKNMSIWEDWSAGGNWKYFTFPLYKMLASGVNAIARSGHPRRAYEIVKEATNPTVMLYHPEVVTAKSEQKQIIKKVLKSTKPIVLQKVVVWTIQTEWHLTGVLATRLGSEYPKPIMVIEKDSGRISLRGDQAQLIRDHVLEHLPNMELAGHKRFMGGNLKSVTMEELLEVLAMM